MACFLCGDRGLADALVNVVLFAPLGVGLALAGLDIRRALLAGVLASLSVELAQVTIIPGRDASLGDLSFNTMGTLVGFGVARLTPALARLDRRTGAQLSVAAALDVALAVALTGWLLQPSFPATTYWGQWTPDLGDLGSYGGRVVTARIDGMEIGSRRVPDSEAVRHALDRGGPIEIRFITGPPVGRLAPLFSIYDDREREIFLLGPDRTDLVVRYRTRAAALRLDQPDLRLRGGWPTLEPGRAASLRVWSAEAGRWCVGGAVAEQCGLGFTIGSGWGMLFYPSSLPAWFHALVTLGWSTALLLPVGLLLRRRWPSLAALAVAALALGTLPMAVGLARTSAIEWAGAVLGIATGALGASLIARSGGPGRNPGGPAAG